MEELKSRIEAILFASSKTLTIDEIARLVKERDLEVVKNVLLIIKKELEEKKSSTMLVEEENKWRLVVREKYLQFVRKIVTQTEISKSILETLAVVAYKAPVLQSKVIKIRTNKAYKHLDELEAKGYLSREKQGKTKLIRLTQKFHDYFELPKEKLQEKFGNVQEIEKAIEEKEKELGVKVEQDEETSIELQHGKHEHKLETFDTIVPVEDNVEEKKSPLEVEKLGELEIFEEEKPEKHRRKKEAKEKTEVETVEEKKVEEPNEEKVEERPVVREEKLVVKTEEKIAEKPMEKKPEKIVEKKVMGTKFPIPPRSNSEEEKVMEKKQEKPVVKQELKQILIRKEEKPPVKKEEKVIEKKPEKPVEKPEEKFVETKSKEQIETEKLEKEIKEAKPEQVPKNLKEAEYKSKGLFSKGMPKEFEEEVEEKVKEIVEGEKEDEESKEE